MKECITLNGKEQQRLMVLGKIDRGGLSAAAAAVPLGLSLRQVRRLQAAYRTEGAAGLAHGNRGRQPAHTLPPEVRARVIALAQEPRYAGCNHQHFTELLEGHAIHLSRPSVRRILLAVGLRSPRRRRPPKHRSRRERMPQEGLLLQWDGSRHDWLEGRGPGSPWWALSMMPPGWCRPRTSDGRRMRRATCWCCGTSSAPRGFP